MRLKPRSALVGLAVMAVLVSPSVALAKEYPIGKPVDAAGMEIGAVYLQPIVMDPPAIMAPAAKTDIHLIPWKNTGSRAQNIDG